jgi:poly-gamma-glutamate synthesis protein (capsule biosynthesis protein)
MQKSQSTLKSGVLSTLILAAIFGSVYNSEKISIDATKIETTARPDTSSSEISLFFVGDLMGHDPMIKAAWNETSGKYEYGHWFQFLSPVLSHYDCAIGNLEVTLGGRPYKGYPQFSSPDAYAAGIQAAGFDFLITANNHSQDRGKAGLERTLFVLDSLKIPHTGTFSDTLSREKAYPYMLEMKGVKIAILNATYGTNGLQVVHPNVVNMMDSLIMKKDIQKAKSAGAQYIIATMHWGNEYQRTESDEQKKWAMWLADQGIDAIIGMHPHVVEPMKFITSKKYPNKQIPVAYSLGNFISNQRERYKDGGIGVELQLKVKEGKVSFQSWGYMPFWCYLGGSPRGYYALPVSDVEKNPAKYKLSAVDQAKLETFAEDTRILLKGIPEIFIK